VTQTHSAPTRALAEWCAAPPSFGAAERHDAARAILDTVACMLAARREPVAAKTLAAVQHWGHGPARVVVPGAPSLAAPWAAMVNGAAAHAQDYDDVLEPAMAHASAVLVPALLALAEERRASGAALIEAFLVGIEVMARLGEALNMAHYAAGWHTTLTLGAPAAAAACARLMRLDAGRTRVALSQSMSMAGGSKRHMGVMAKPIHAGLAAKAGLMAAALAEQGTTANAEIFAGPWGALEMMAGPAAPGFRPDFLDGSPAMREHGVWLKAYPTCASTHRAVDGILALRARHGLTPDNVAAIHVTLPKVADQNLMFDIPSTPGEARFSMHYCAAAALADGALGPSAFTDGAIARKDLAALMARVTRSVREDQAEPGADLSDQTSTVAIRTTDGAQHEIGIEVPRGHPANPLTDADLSDKFDACAAAGGLSPATAHALRDRLFAIETAELSALDWAPRETEEETTT